MLSGLVQELYPQAVTEMMMTQFRELDLYDIWTELDLQCPSGTAFSNEQHLLNKFRSVATRMLQKKNKTGPAIRTQTYGPQEAIAVASYLPIKNL